MSFSNTRRRAAMMLPQYVDQVPKTRRVMRRPQHTFQLETRPFLLQPFMIAPVLPGETLKNLLLQSRVVTDPIKNPLIGWWKEYYFFYVRHRDLAGSATFQKIMLDPSTNVYAQVPGYHAAADTLYNYQYTGSVKWLDQCMDVIVPHYFRTPTEHSAVTWDDYIIDNLHPISVNKDSWLDSVVLYSAADLGGEIPEDAGNISYNEFDRLQTQYDALRDARLVDMDYDDWLATYGVALPKAEEPGKPELVRYVRSWQYPSNTVEPTTGIPASAVSWAIAERADKDRFFKEPGFLIGVTTTRPKVYFSNQTGYAAGMLNNAFAWLPAVMQDDHPEVSLKLMGDLATQAAGGPLGVSTSAGYWVDLRDLFLYGDQFVNFALTETDSHLFALPTAAVQKRYPASADLDTLFKSASPLNKVREDGVVNLGILGRQVDMT